MYNCYRFLQMRKWQFRTNSHACRISYPHVMETNTAFARGSEEDAIRVDGDRPAGAELISCSPIEQHCSIILLKLPN